MTARVSSIFALLCACLAWIAGFGAARLHAEAGASAWQEAPHSRLRLISASGLIYQGKPAQIAGIEIRLDEGWKTYWRTPGDGLPPSVDWTGSDNLAGATVLWPAPRRFQEAEGAFSVGYQEQMVLPLLLAAKDGSQPIGLRLALSYGICKDICIPIDANLALEIPQSPHETYREILRAALDGVPRVQQQGVYCPHSFITAAERAVGGKPALVIKTAHDEKATGLDLFVEAPDGGELPSPSAQPPSSRGRSHYVMLFDTEEALRALQGKVLTLTLTSDQGSCESTWRVK